MKLILHIGTPKTASTLLQNSFEQNPDWLARHGVAYGRALAPDANHITLFIAAAIGVHSLSKAYGIHTEDDILAFRAVLLEELRACVAEQLSHIHTMVLSSENLTGNLRSTEGLQNLRAMLEPLFESIEIVVYVRRQDDAILSMYSEFMRRGFSGATIDKFMTNCMSDTCPIPYIYYRRELLKWIEVWGREALTVRLFDRAQFVGGEILTDFASVVLGHTDFDMSAFIPAPSDNRALSAPTLEVLRLLWPTIPFLIDGEPNPTRIDLMGAINELPTEPRPILGPRRAARIMEYFEAPNAWLHETFFPELPAPLFAPREPDSPRTNLGAASPEEIAEIGGLFFGALRRAGQE